MIFINKFLDKKNFLSKLTLIFFFLISWFSISSSHYDLLIFNSQKNLSLVTIINFIRPALNLMCFPVLCIMFVDTLIKEGKDNLKSNLSFFLFLFYFLSQIPGLFYTSNTIGNILYVISSVNILLIVNISIKKFPSNEIILLIYAACIFLLFFIILFTGKDLYKYLYGINTQFYGNINNFLGENYIRSSGKSRIALVLLIFCSVFLINFNKFKFFNYISLIALTSVIYLYQSRIAIGTLIIFIVFNFIMREKFTLNNILKYFLVYIVFPFLIVIYMPSMKLDIPFPMPPPHDIAQKERFIVAKKMYAQEQTIFCKYTLIKCESIPVRQTEFINETSNKINFISTSGRVNDWKRIISNYDYNKYLFFGYGAQGDRFLINQSASNAILYALTSGGFVGMIFFLLFSIIAFFQLFKYVFLNSEKNIICHFSTSIILIFLIRSLAESSYALFGVDLILFYTCFAFSEKFIRTKVK